MDLDSDYPKCNKGKLNIKKIGYFSLLHVSNNTKVQI